METNNAYIYIGTEIQMPDIEQPVAGLKEVPTTLKEVDIHGSLGPQDVPLSLKVLKDVGAQTGMKLETTWI